MIAAVGRSAYDVYMRAHTKLIKELEISGHTVETTGNGHLKVRRPNGSYAMTMSHSPGDKGAALSARRLALRLGLLEKSC